MACSTIVSCNRVTSARSLAISLASTRLCLGRPGRDAANAARTPSRAVFISYARDDVEMASGRRQGPLHGAAAGGCARHGREPLKLVINPERLYLFDPDSGAALS